jgi:hypothetical protein
MHRRGRRRLHCRTTNADFLLAQRAASRLHEGKMTRHDSVGKRGMLDAIEISLALWAMIVCGGIKAAQVLPYLF